MDHTIGNSLLNQPITVRIITEKCNKVHYFNSFILPTLRRAIWKSSVQSGSLSWKISNKISMIPFYKQKNTGLLDPQVKSATKPVHAFYWALVTLESRHVKRPTNRLRLLQSWLGLSILWVLSHTRVASCLITALPIGHARVWIRF